MSSAVVRTYSGGVRGEILFVEKEKRISGHFFCFLRAEKTLGKLFVCDAEILLYTQEKRKRKSRGNSAHKKTQQKCFVILTRHIKIYRY